MAIIMTGALNSQDTCQLTLSGKVIDNATGEPLDYALVYTEEGARSVFTNESGAFQLSGLCPGGLHLSITHLNCAPVEQYIELEADSNMVFRLDHHAELLDEVVIHGHHDHSTTSYSSAISQDELRAESYKSLADISSRIVGVSSLRNGVASSKPIVHGMYGNRITIMNNGISQSGQQWGVDHAPEIDASSAHHISVVKGAAALEYMGSNMGAVILVDSKTPSSDPHLKGQFNYIYHSNGRGHTFNTSIEQASKQISWVLNGTFKHSGDTRTPNYFLKNTGRRERNFAFKAERKNTDKWHTDIYISSFNANLGILRGSHISNLTDLEDALERSEPFFTEDSYADSIAPPRQLVGHHLVKLENTWFLNEDSFIKATYGGQLNKRKEFDVRRSGRSDQPALDLQQFSHFGELKLLADIGTNITFKTGLQLEVIDNANLEGTGVLPLIPDYRSWNPGLFAVGQFNLRNTRFELGTRLDIRKFEVRRISNSLPREVIREERNFLNTVIMGGIVHEFNKQVSIRLNAGLAMRAPEINELYSNGLHQGVSGIEEGDPGLEAEQAIKLVGNLDWNPAEGFFIQALGYYQRVSNYIYLQAQDSFRLTIRGAFPLFRYEQTNADIHGLDFLASLQLSKRLKAILKYARVRGRDRTADLGIVNLPADNLSLDLQYAAHSNGLLNNSYLHITGAYTWRQSRINEVQDFVVPPPAYFLLAMRLGSDIRLGGGKRLTIECFAENILNTQYRDYLNRLRYFADDLGRNIGMRLNYKWGA